MLESILFYLFSFGVVAFALGVVAARSAVYGVLSLVGAMCMMAGLFVLLKAYLVATVLVLVYAGAILVLFLFVVMLIDFRKLTLDWPKLRFQPLFAAALGGALFFQFYKVIGTVEMPAGSVPLDGTAEALGTLLFTRYLLPFELTSFLILAAVVSVVVLAKKDAE
jgi:NADH-quinone oxidoreductase subunit J